MGETTKAASDSRAMAVLRKLVLDLEMRANLKQDPNERGIVDVSHGIYAEAKDILSEQPAASAGQGE